MILCAIAHPWIRLVSAMTLWAGNIVMSIFESYYFFTEWLLMSVAVGVATIFTGAISGI